MPSGYGHGLFLWRSRVPLTRRVAHDQPHLQLWEHPKPLASMGTHAHSHTRTHTPKENKIKFIKKKLIKWWLLSMWESLCCLLCSSLAFNIIRAVPPSSQLFYSISIELQGNQMPFVVHAHPAQGNSDCSFCLYTFAFSRHFIKMEPFADKFYLTF